MLPVDRFEGVAQYKSRFVFDALTAVSAPHQSLTEVKLDSLITNMAVKRSIWSEFVS